MDEIKKKLKNMVAASEIVKNWTAGQVTVARMLMDENDKHEIEQLALEVASNVSSIENNLSEFTRFTPQSKKFVAIREK